MERPKETGGRVRGCGATYCYGCLCDTCANSVELHSWYVTIGEASEPCFSCDECRHYDGDCGKRSQWHDACPQYIEAKKAREARARAEAERALAEEKRAQAASASFKVIKGGDGRVQEPMLE